MKRLALKVTLMIMSDINALLKKNSYHKCFQQKNYHGRPRSITNLAFQKNAIFFLLLFKF